MLQPPALLNFTKSFLGASDALPNSLLTTASIHPLLSHTLEVISAKYTPDT
jgi:hypothetical protein